MSVTIRIEVSSESIDKILDRLDKLDGQAQAALEIAGSEAQRIVAERFKAQGPGWAPLAARTELRRRNKKKSSIKILQDTGKLRNSIVTRGAEDSVYELDGKELLIGSNVIYAAIHNFGWPASAKHPPPPIPARRYLPTPEELIPRVESKLARWVRDYLNGA